MERRLLETNRLQARLKKLIEVGVNPSLTAAQLKEAEQETVAWESDHNVSECRICSTTFSFWTRKHHCRLCGRVVCGSCSAPKYFHETLSIRLCKECNATVELRKLVLDTTAPIVEMHQLIEDTKEKVSGRLDEFQNVLSQLRNLASSNHDAESKRLRSLACTYKKDLEEYFASMDRICQRISKLPASTSADAKLHQNIIRAVTDYLHSHLGKLNDASLVLSPSTAPSASKPIPADPTASPNVSAGEDEEYLQTLIEQFTRVDDFLSEARSKRMVDAARSLTINREEIAQEIARVEMALYGTTRFATKPS